MTAKKKAGGLAQLPPELQAMLPALVGPTVNSSAERAYLRWRWSELYSLFLHEVNAVQGGDDPTRAALAAQRADWAWEEERKRPFVLVSM